MLITPTLDKLRGLNLMGMARALDEQMERADFQALSFEDRLGLMVDREAQDRDNRRFERHLKSAKLRAAACIEDLDFRRARGLDRSLMLSLADAEWVRGWRCLCRSALVRCPKSANLLQSRSPLCRCQENSPPSSCPHSHRSRGQYPQPCRRARGGDCEPARDHLDDRYGMGTRRPVLGRIQRSRRHARRSSRQHATGVRHWRS